MTTDDLSGLRERIIDRARAVRSRDGSKTPLKGFLADWVFEAFADAAIEEAATALSTLKDERDRLEAHLAKAMDRASENYSLAVKVLAERDSFAARVGELEKLIGNVIADLENGWEASAVLPALRRALNEQATQEKQEA